ncbi:MAG TPA: SRPBCC family protein [Bacteroidales bacterium]|nr:SRPBCC family protein [Bacteroidales bacterium]HPT12888.1 SRPBCC family protein [Bacteroidales bacterium]
MKKVKLLLAAIFCTMAIYGQKMNVEPNTKGTYAIDSIKINAPVDKVYSLITDINDWPGWFSGVKEVKINGKAEEGKPFVWKANGYKIRSVLHTVRANSCIGWTGKIWWISAVHNWHFSSSSDGGTMVIVEESFGGLGSALMKNSLRKDMRNDLINLKKKSEI